jgi:hypothetical protein
MPPWLLLRALPLGVPCSHAAGKPLQLSLTPPLLADAALP